MENIEKENKRLKILIVILLVFLMALGGYYFYDNIILNDNNKNTNNEVDEISVNEEEQENTWISYLINAQDVKATLTENFTEDSDDSFVPTKRVLNSDELKEYLLNLSKCECHNLINGDGFGGSQHYTVDISYTVNNTEFSFLLYNGNYFLATGTEKKLVDDELVKLLTEDFPEEENENPIDGNTHVFKFDYECATSAVETYFN